MFDGEPEAIRLVQAENLFGEAEAVASEILRLARAGYRYREIAVLARGTDAYAGVLDAVLRQNHIPFFFTEKEELLSYPLLTFVGAAMELVTTDFAPYAVRRYIKSGYAGGLVDAESGDLLLRYAESWGLRGKAWYGEERWERNPDGFREGEPTEEQTALLAAVNGAREALAPAWRELVGDLRKKPLSGRDILRAVYGHLERVGAPALYVEKVNARLQSGEWERAEKESQLWSLLTGIFERLDEVCGEKPMTVRQVHSLFLLTVRQYSLGSIPTSQDSVTVGEASLLRPDRVRAVIVMGCGDGVFPASPGNDPLFGDAEAAELETAGLSVVEPRLSRLRAERFYFYSAVAAPSEQLVLTYPASSLKGETLRPSPAILRIRALFPRLRTRLYTGVGEQALFSAENASAAFFTFPAGKERDALRALLAEKGIRPPAARPAIADPVARIAFGERTLRLSPTALERYRYCPFSYFGRYLLKLREPQKNRFDTATTGTFVHRIFERFLERRIVDGRFVPPASEAELDRETDELFREQLDAMNAANGANARFRLACRNLRRLLRLLLGNLSGELAGSRCLPTGFEVRIGGADGIPAPELPCGDGRTVALRGVIDRVDEYERDGERYVRVVDYKTYDRPFSLHLVREYGLDEQMLLYLFAYCRASADGRARPAGVLYRPAILPSVKTTGGESDDEIRKMAEEELRQDGLILADADIARAMDESGSGTYIPVKFEPDGTVKQTASTLPADGFDELGRLLASQLLETAGNIFGGRMDVCPVSPDDRHKACTYCNLRSACRRSGTDPDTEEE